MFLVTARVLNQGVSEVHIQLIVGKPNADPILSFNEIDTEGLEPFEPEIVPTDREKALGLDDIRINPLLSRRIVDVSPRHLECGIDTLETELKHRDTRPIFAFGSA